MDEVIELRKYLPHNTVGCRLVGNNTQVNTTHVCVNQWQSCWVLRCVVGGCVTWLSEFTTRRFFIRGVLNVCHRACVRVLACVCMRVCGGGGGDGRTVCIVCFTFVQELPPRWLNISSVRLSACACLSSVVLGVRVVLCWVCGVRACLSACAFVGSCCSCCSLVRWFVRPFLRSFVLSFVRACVCACM